MGYIETVLVQDECVLHRCYLHWIIYAPAVGLLVAGATIIMYSAATTITGRLLDFGTVTVRGTGAGIDPIAKVAEPLVLREAVGWLASGRVP
jgi:hypothetical protein